MADLYGVNDPKDYFDPNQWTSNAGQGIDAGRHYGSASIATLLPELQGQLADVPQGLGYQRQARAQVNQFLSPEGRQQRTKSFARQRDQQAFQAGKKLKAMLESQGRGDQGVAALLSQQNQAALDTGNYQANMESPESIAKMAHASMEINDPTQVVSLLKALGIMDEQDFRRFQIHLQDSASDRGGVFGQVLGALGQAAGSTDWSKGF